jgi:hypothetical protein
MKLIDEIKTFFYSRNKIIDELKERAKPKQYKPRTRENFFYQRNKIINELKSLVKNGKKSKEWR